MSNTAATLSSELESLLADSMIDIDEVTQVTTDEECLNSLYWGIKHVTGGYEIITS